MADSKDKQPWDWKTEPVYCPRCKEVFSAANIVIERCLVTRTELSCSMCDNTQFVTSARRKTIAYKLDGKE